MVDMGFKNHYLLEQVRLKDAVTTSYHPVYQYFDKLTWDGTSYLHPNGIGQYIQDADDLFWYLLQKWMVGAVAKVYTGAQNPMLVLAGSQGVGKSVFVQWLCPLPELYLDSAISPDS
jgi:predicted P-loop ATPase